jgi:ABC-type phosphate/phosphonate transport system substrate-binding protein
MIAGLPMYDPPELHRIVDAWWSGLARAFRAEGIDDVPDGLDRSRAAEALWAAPDLIFAQACGFPLVTSFTGRLRYLATPHYAGPGCEGPLYCSWIVVPADSTVRTIEDLRGKCCSISGRISHSGYNALRALIAPLACNGRFFGSVSVSGGHAASLAQLARGATDVAAIDCITYALLGRCRPQVVAATRVIGRTASAPGLPYVTGASASPDLIRRLRAGLFNALADPGLAAVRNELLIAGVDVLPLERYGCMTEMAAEAQRLRYVELD